MIINIDNKIINIDIEDVSLIEVKENSIIIEYKNESKSTIKCNTSHEAKIYFNAILRYVENNHSFISINGGNM